MQIEQVTVIIDQSGQVQLTVEGVKGQQCCAITKDLESALGSQIASRQLTSEAYESACNSGHIQSRAGRNEFGT